MATNNDRPRAVFSTEDFKLLRDAVAQHLPGEKDPQKAAKYGSLYHRLGRLG